MSSLTGNNNFHQLQRRGSKMQPRKMTNDSEKQLTQEGVKGQSSY